MTHLPASDLPPDIRLEYPYAGNVLKLPSGAQMHYLDEGRGPVVVLLHGNPTWSFYFRKLINQLAAAGFRCIAPDHVGCGLSEKPGNYDYRLKQRIDDVASLVEHLDLSSYHLVVHDWGGAIGCGLAARQPSAIERMVVLNTAAFRSKRIPARIALLKIPAFGPALIRGLNAFAGPAAIMSVCKPLAPAVKRGMLWPYRSWSDRIAVWQFVKDIPLTVKHRSYQTLVEVEAGLAGLADKPVLLFWGAQDFCFNRHFYARWQSLFPRARCQLLDNCGHYVLEDADADQLQGIVNFLHE